MLRRSQRLIAPYLEFSLGDLLIESFCGLNVQDSLIAQNYPNLSCIPAFMATALIYYLLSVICKVASDKMPFSFPLVADAVEKLLSDSASGGLSLTRFLAFLS